MADINRKWDPWKMYDVSESELRTIKERAKMREAMKAEWVKKSTDPFKATESGGYLFDPAVQRFISLKATQADYFKGTKKSVAIGLSILFLPVFAMTYIAITDKAKRENLYRNGEVMYKDRRDRFMS